MVNPVTVAAKLKIFPKPQTLDQKRHSAKLDRLDQIETAFHSYRDENINRANINTAVASIW
jgi:hypothetical protein